MLNMWIACRVAVVCFCISFIQALTICPNPVEPTSGECFWLYNSTTYVNYHNASGNCAEMGGVLPVIDMPEKIKYIYNTITQQSYWLDLNRNTANGSCNGWCWRNTDPLNITSLAEWYNESALSTDNNCAYFSAAQNQIISLDCYSTDAIQFILCQAKPCGPPTPVSNANAVETRKTAKYTCHPGHYFSSSLTTATSQCSMAGTWSTISGGCNVENCGMLPPTPQKSTIESQVGSPFIHTVVYKCWPGYMFKFATLPGTMICGFGGKWILPGICLMIDCGTAPGVNNALLISSTGKNFGNTTMYGCDAGYKFADNSTIATTTCLQNETWSLIGHCNAIDCGPIPDIPNAFITSSNGTLQGSVAKYECLVGNIYLINGVRSGTIFETNCTFDGVWSDIGVCTTAFEMETKFDTEQSQVTSQQVKTSSARSKLHCASLCAKDQCYSFDYNKEDKSCSMFGKYNGKYGVDYRYVK